MVTGTKKNWYHFYFYFVSKKGEKYATTDSPLHILIAHKCFSFLLDEKYDGLLWRFHRMQIDNKVNHWKFKVYTTKRKFDEMVKQIQKPRILKKLTVYDYIEKVEFGVATDSNDNVGSDRDNAWPYVIRESWPYFIHGASKCFLQLVNSVIKRYCEENYITLNSKMDMSEQLEFYDKIVCEMYDIWKTWSQHVFCHHTSALFGYNYSDFIFRDILGLKVKRSWWKFGKTKYITGKVKF